MSPRDNIEKTIQQFDIDINPKRDEEIFNHLRETMSKSKQSKPNTRHEIWRIIMHNKITKPVAAAVIIIAVFIGMNMFNGTPAWALDQTIEAMKEYSGAYLSGVCPGQTGSLVGFELWIRINDADPSTKNILVKTDDGIIRWTQDNATYTYIPAENTVYYENAVTIGFTHFLGPELFELLSSLKDAKTKYGFDPATRRDYAILSGSITDIHGSKSLQVEFDVETKLVTSLKQWENLPQPTLTFDASNIRYFEQLPDSTFEVSIPTEAKYAEAPFIIPQANLEILSKAQYGISAEGLSKEQAGREILEKIYQALIEGDLKRFRQLAPVTEAWTDEFLKKALDIGTDKQIVKVLKIGSISKESTTSIGPVVVIPVTTQRKDGTVWQTNTIIQFRKIDDKSSCVVHGPYGLPTQLEE
jgi:hypothetical protein